MNVTWNPSDKTANVTLSGSNLIATASGAGWIRATDRQATGKYYWEVRPTVWANGNSAPGIVRGDLTPNGVTGDNGAYVYRSGTILFNGASTGSTLGTRANGDIIGIALNMDALLIFFRVAPSGNWNGSATADPATGVGGISIAALFGGLTSISAYPSAYLGANLESMTANFGDSAFTGTVPSGYISGFPAGAVIAPMIYDAGLIRETLLIENAQINNTGMVREVLLATLTAATVSGLVREILLADPVVGGQQYAVTIVT